MSQKEDRVRTERYLVTVESEFHNWFQELLPATRATRTSPEKEKGNGVGNGGETAHGLPGRRRRPFLWRPATP